MNVTQTPDTIADFYDSLNEARENFRLLLDCTGQWVVVGSSKPDRNYIFVGEQKPTYNNTQFAVLSPLTADFALRFDSEKEARKYGFNDYLRDGENKPIYMKAMRVSDFANMVIADADDIMHSLIELRQSTNKI